MGEEVRLESWKSIAAYLNRDVRTVQRWEQRDGLPVHRFRRAHRSLPYAFKADIDRWWSNRSYAATSSVVDSTGPYCDQTALKQRVGAVAVLTVLIASVVLWVRPRRS